MTVARNQERQARYLAERGLALLAGDPAAVGEEVTRLAADEAQRRRLAAAGRAAVDGRGAFRVAERLSALIDSR
jgi:spore coat polysaccharide biosynthesis predicted glycosyltransferase SpsG